MPDEDSLPAIRDILFSSADQSAPLTNVLSILFEPSDVLLVHLVPQVKERLISDEVTTYCGLIDASLTVISEWDEELRTKFIAGHPRIGEVDQNLSKFSAQEQAAYTTPPEVLARLQHLNACYERRYPGLIYITFVNGRTRAAIKEEIEDKLGLSRSLSTNQPPLSSITGIPKDDKRWREELERAVQDVGKIAESRVRGMGLM